VRLNASAATPTNSARHGGAAYVEHAFEDIPARVDLAQNIVGADIYVLEHDSRSIVRIHGRGALGAKPPSARVNQEQRESVGIPRLTRGASDRDQKMRDMAIDHESLGAVQFEAVSGASGTHRGFFRMMLRGFVDGQCGDQLAGND
jgi:hypothetical protein